MLYIFSIMFLIIIFLLYKQSKNKQEISTLTYENNKHKKMLNATLEAVVFFSNHKIIDLNDGALELFGYNSKDNLIGKSYSSFVDKDDLLLVEEKITKRFIGKYEVKLTKNNNSKFPALVQINRFEKEDSDLIIVNILDLTDIKRREQILSQNTKMAQMGEMIGNIAHQWRQPLSVITTAASGIKMKKEYDTISDEELYKLLDSIVLNSQHLSDTIDIFRNFIKEKVELKKVVIQNRINNALSIIETRLKNKHIQLINNIDYTKSINVIIILGELSQVIINIMNNAIDALENNNDNKQITIDLLYNDKNAIITIEDNGGGISDEIFPHIFEPYFTTKHKSVGTGIGLYMSYDIIVNRMKGKLYAKNTKSGAKFFIELPIDTRSKDRRVANIKVKEERRIKDRRAN